jgi:hypothetical protein
VKTVRTFLAYGNVVVALAAMALVPLEFWAEGEGRYPLFVFCSTLAAYGYMHLRQLKETVAAVHPVLFFTQSNRFTVTALTIVAALLATWLLMKLPTIQQMLIIPAIAISALYPSTPLVQGGLRSVPKLKLPLIAFTWMWVCVVIPAWPLQFVDGLRMAMVFSWILALAIAFDIRDLHYDKAALQTLPQKNRAGALRWAHGFNMLAALATGGLLNTVGMGWKGLFQLLPFALTALALERIKRSPDPLFISFYVEALPLSYFLIALWLV